MRNIFLLLGTLVTALLLFILIFFLFFNNDEEVVDPGNGVEFPIAQPGSGSETPSSEDTIPMRTKEGSAVAVRDFRQDEFVETVDDENYIIRDAESPDNASFEILYAGSTGGIIVSLREEPIRDTRLAAERALAEHLGISQEQLCQLAISVGVAADVNDFYAGQELGVSGCEGSQRL